MEKLERQLEDSGKELQKLREFLSDNPLNFTKNAQLAEVLRIHVELLDKVQEMHLREIGG